LLREVRVAAADADGPDEFLGRLKSAGLLVRPRLSQLEPGGITGYSVALPGHRTAAGQPVWYGGSKLAADLSWTRLSQKWDRLAAGHPGTLADQTADLLQLLARRHEGRGGGPLTAAATSFERTRREPFNRVAPSQASAVARSIARAVPSSRGRQTADVARTLDALVDLMNAVSRLRAAQGRPAQQQAAAFAATALRRHTRRALTTTRPAQARNEQLARRLGP
jgi:hypothetical protein